MEHVVNAINEPVNAEHKKLIKEKKAKKVGWKGDCLQVAVHKDFARRGIAANLTNLLA
jgi:ribosomal protein S18 acetylase RimI-like enzyme